MNINFSKPMINDFTLTHIIVGKTLYMFKEPCKFRVETNSHCLYYRDALIKVENYERYFQSEPFIRENFNKLWNNGHDILAKTFENALIVKNNIDLEDNIRRNTILLEHFIPMTILPDVKKNNNIVITLCYIFIVIGLMAAAWISGFQHGGSI